MPNFVLESDVVPPALRKRQNLVRELSQKQQPDGGGTRTCTFCLICAGVFSDSPSCRALPTAATSKPDNTGRLWGTANGAACAFKDATGRALFYTSYEPGSWLRTPACSMPAFSDNSVADSKLRVSPMWPPGTAFCCNEVLDSSSLQSSTSCQLPVFALQQRSQRQQAHRMLTMSCHMLTTYAVCCAMLCCAVLCCVPRRLGAGSLPAACVPSRTTSSCPSPSSAPTPCCPGRRPPPAKSSLHLQLTLQ